jgi:dTDP-4-amino-4,6-dideoxygalactose transaminase
VVPVHEFGLAADMKGVLSAARQYGLEVVEDAACALGATWRGKPVGTLGRLGTFSFHPRKAITTGEGGAIVTNDDELAGRCRTLRNHGQQTIDGTRDFAAAGMNYRMTEFQAAIGSVQLAKFPEILRKRRELAAGYLEQLAGLPGLRLPASSPEHTWQTFMVVLDDGLDRDRIIERLADAGIEAGPGSVAGHGAAVYRERFGYQPDELPCAAQLDSAGLALPLQPRMDLGDLLDCVACISTLLAQAEITLATPSES